MLGGYFILPHPVECDKKSVTMVNNRRCYGCSSTVYGTRSVEFLFYGTVLIKLKLMDTCDSTSNLYTYNTLK